MHLYSNSLSTLATISSLFKSELLSPCFSCHRNFNLSQKSFGSDDTNIVFETHGAETNKPGDLSFFISVLSLIAFLSMAFRSKFISFAKPYITFLSDKLARSTL